MDSMDFERVEGVFEVISEDNTTETNAKAEQEKEQDSKWILGEL